MKSTFSHLNKEGNPAMVDVGAKVPSKRSATARSIVVLGIEIMSRLENNELFLPKGPVFQTAILAGIMGTKQTGYLIPLCHPLALEKSNIEIKKISNAEIEITCTVSLEGKTGVEMEALMGCSIAALTIYDMCKALSHDITIRETRLLTKTGGKNDYTFTDQNDSRDLNE